MPDRPAARPERFTVTPEQYARVAWITLGMLTLIVLTGAAVRLTGSGLGCPDWPKCYGGVVAPLRTHAVIEYGNRIISGLVGVAAVTAGLLAWRRRPFRRDLMLIGALLPFGVVGQAVLGGFTVRHDLAPGYVMGHFALSMIILVAGVALAWRASHQPGAREPSGDRRLTRAVRALIPLGALTIVVGSAATAAGPHAGASGTGQRVPRLDFRGHDTLNFMIHNHGAVASALGVLAVGLWVFARRRDAGAELRRALTVLLGLLVAQGIVGGVQYATHLPTEIVWVHVSLATLTWLSILWSVAEAGVLAPSTELAPGVASEGGAPQLGASGAHGAH